MSQKSQKASSKNLQQPRGSTADAQKKERQKFPGDSIPAPKLSQKPEQRFSNQNLSQKALSLNESAKIVKNSSVISRNEEAELAKLALSVNSSPGKHMDQMKQTRFLTEEESLAQNAYHGHEFLKYGDMPKVFAFEVENNMREAISSLMKPIIEQHEQLKKNMADNNNGYNQVMKAIDKVNARLNDNLNLTDSIKDVNKRMKMLSDSIDHGKDDMREKIGKTSVLVDLHEKTMAKLQDEMVDVVRKSEQCRKDVREFETLTADFNIDNQRFALDQFKTAFNEIQDMKFEMDSLKQQCKEVFTWRHKQKGVDGAQDIELRLIKEQIKAQGKEFLRLESLEEIIRQNERYLGYVLPLQMQEQIYKSVKPMAQNKEQLLALMEAQSNQVSTKVEDLVQADRNVHEEKEERFQREKEAAKSKSNLDKENSLIVHGFSKTRYEVPDFKEVIDELKEAIRLEKEEESESSDDASEDEDTGSLKDSSAKQSEEPPSDKDQVLSEKSKEQEPEELSPSKTPDLSDTQVEQPIETEPKKTPKQPVKTQESPRPKYWGKPIAEELKMHEYRPELEKKVEPKKDIKEFLSPKTDKKKDKKKKAVSGGLKGVAYKLKLSHLKISSKQLYRFATRIGRRLLKNPGFISKLNEVVQDNPVSDTSEKKEDRWGLENDPMQDLRSYIIKPWMKDSLDSENSTMSEWSSDDEKRSKSHGMVRHTSQRNLYIKKSMIHDNNKQELRKRKAQEKMRSIKKMNMQTIAGITKQIYQKAKEEKETKEKTEKIAQVKVLRDEKLAAKQATLKAMKQKDEEFSDLDVVDKKKKKKSKKKHKREVRQESPISFEEPVKEKKKSKKKAEKVRDESPLSEEEVVEVVKKPPKKKKVIRQESPISEEEIVPVKTKKKSIKIKSPEQEKPKKRPPSFQETKGPGGNIIEEAITIKQEDNKVQLQTKKSQSKQQSSSREDAEKLGSILSSKHRDRSISGSKQSKTVTIVSSQAQETYSSEEESSSEESSSGEDGSQSKFSQLNNMQDDLLRLMKRVNELERQQKRQDQLKINSNPASAITVREKASTKSGKPLSNKRDQKQPVKIETQRQNISKERKLDMNNSQSELEQGTPHLNNSLISSKLAESKLNETEDSKLLSSVTSEDYGGELNQLRRQLNDLRKYVDRSLNGQLGLGAGPKEEQTFGFKRSEAMNEKQIDREISYVKQNHGQATINQSDIDIAVGEAINMIDKKVREFDSKLQAVSQIKEQMHGEFKRLKRQDFTFEKRFDQNENKVKNNFAKLEEINNRLTLTDNSMSILFKLLRITYALDHQDECDKQDVYLFGQSNIDNSFDEGLSKRKNVVVQGREGNKLLQFDSNCISCGMQGQKASNIPHLSKALKMACLNYKPSDVLFENKKYERGQLVEAQGYLLYLALNQLKHLNLNTADQQLLGSSANVSKFNIATDETLSPSATFEDIFKADKDNRSAIFESVNHNDSKDSMLKDDFLHDESIQKANVQTGKNSRRLSMRDDLKVNNQYTRKAQQVPGVFTFKGGNLVNNESKLYCKRCNDEIPKDQTFRKPSPVKQQPIRTHYKSVQQDLRETKHSQRDRNDRSSQRNVYNFNTINVVGSPANMHSSLMPQAQGLAPLVSSKVGQYNTGYNPDDAPPLLQLSHNKTQSIQQDYTNAAIKMPMLKRQVFTRGPQFQDANVRGSLETFDKNAFKFTTAAPRTARGNLRDVFLNSQNQFNAAQVLSARASLDSQGSSGATNILVGPNGSQLFSQQDKITAASRN